MRRTTAALVVTQVDELEALRGELATVRAELRELRARLDAGYRVGPDDDRIRVVIARSTAGAWFKAAHLLQHARVDAGLAAALEASCIETTGDIGILLRRLRGRQSTITVERRGRLWRVTHETRDVSSAITRVTLPT